MVSMARHRSVISQASEAESASDTLRYESAANEEIGADDDKLDEKAEVEATDEEASAAEVESDMVSHAAAAGRSDAVGDWDEALEPNTSACAAAGVSAGPPAKATGRECTRSNCGNKRITKYSHALMETMRKGQHDWDSREHVNLGWKESGI